MEFSVPATCANLGPGFGVLGLAVDLPMRITVQETQNAKYRVTRQGEMSGVADDPRHDSILRAMLTAAENFKIKLPTGLDIHAESPVPAFTGLGTNSANFAAGLGIAVRYAKQAPAADELTDLLVTLGGTASHGGAALYGGLVATCPVQVAREVVSHRVFRYPISENWHLVLACPEIRVATADVRRVLPAALPHNVTRRTSGRLLGLLHALAEADADLLQKCLIDEVHVPYRRNLVPGMNEAMLAGQEAGAAGVTISGAGPALVAFSLDADKTSAIGEAMSQAFQQAELKSKVLNLRPATGGGLPSETES